MRKKVLCFVFVVVLMLVAMPAYAGESTDTTYGSCTTAYITHATLTNTAGGWTSFEFTPNNGTEIQYANTGSYSIPIHDGHVYGYARPQGTDGTLYGTAFKIYRTHTTVWIPNSSGSTASSAKFKVYNGLYVDENYTLSTMTIPKSYKATIKGIF